MGLFKKKKNEEPVRQLFPGNTSVSDNTANMAESEQAEVTANMAESEQAEVAASMAESEQAEVAAGMAESEQAEVAANMAEMENNRKNAANSLKINLHKSSNDGNLNTVFEDVLDYFIANEEKLLAAINGDKSGNKRKELVRKAKEQFKAREIGSKHIDELLDKFCKYLWGYDVLEPLIMDKSIFDIKCYSYNHIRIKKMGKRMDAPEGITFLSPEDYKRFVRVTATKNRVNLSVINALVTFTDTESSKDFILRFNISTDFINSSKMPCLHIRKIPKSKYSMDELVTLGFMTPCQKKYFEEKVECGGILFTGSGGSGKTTFMNSLLELYPHDRSGLVIQENEELFSDTHPDINFQHVVISNGESRVSYDLEKLARQGLLDDIDLFVIGEIKGKEAGSFAMCSYTGASAWCSCHGKNEIEAIYKLADYVKQATNYSFDESLKLLSGIEIIVYLKNFKIEGVSEVGGWDYENNRLIIEKKYFDDMPLSANMAESYDLDSFIF